MIRIVGGTHRGRRLDVPPGKAVRPTADRTREAIFNMLAHGTAAIDFRDATVLDLFCGTGAFGLEALSRGAAKAVLVDADPAVLRVAEGNATILKELQRVTLLRTDATTPLPVRPQPARLVFLDPPYGQNLTVPVLRQLEQSGWLEPDARIVVETGRDEDFHPPDRFSIIDSRRYGAARVIFLAVATA